MPSLPVPQNTGRRGEVEGIVASLGGYNTAQLQGDGQIKQGQRLHARLEQAVAQSHGDLMGLQFKPWNLKGWSMEKSRLTVPDSQELSSGQARRACQMGSVAA